MIDQATVDKIIDSANILEVVSDFVTLRKRGVNYVGLCPFMMRKLHLSVCLLLKASANVSVAEREVVPCISSWNMNNFPTMKP